MKNLKYFMWIGLAIALIGALGFWTIIPMGTETGFIIWAIGGLLVSISLIGEAIVSRRNRMC